MAKKAAQATVTIKLVKSTICCKADQIATVKSLGLKKLGDVTVKSYGGGHIDIKRVYNGSVYLAHVNVGEKIRIALRGETLLEHKTNICDKDATVERYGFILERFFEEM